MKGILALLLCALYAFGASGSNQQNSAIWGDARIENINKYQDGLAPLWVELQGGHYFAYALVILVAVVVFAFVLHYLIVGPRHYHHDGQKIYAFNLFIRIIHALAAISWVILVPTGAIMMWGESFGGGAFVRFCKNAHGFATILFAISVLPMAIYWFKAMLPALYDIKWMMMVGGYLNKKHQAIPAGKFNAGQKAWFFIAVPGGIIMIITGAFMYFMDFANGDVASFFGLSQIELLRASAIIHNTLGIVCAVFLLVHLYMAAVAVAGAIHSMITGYQEEEEIYTLHHYWYQELKRKGIIKKSKYEDIYKPLE